MGEPFIASAIDLVDHRRLVPADYNPRHMDPRTLRVLVRSLVNFGWVMPVVANRRTGHIVGGHQRLRANSRVLRTLPPQRAERYRRVPVIYVDLPIEREKDLNVALNQISGDWDFFRRAAADELRQNATFAQMARRAGRLSRAYLAPLGVPQFDWSSRAHARLFHERYGDCILDFGCGRGQEIEWLRKIGVNAIGFEPFRRVAGTDRLDVAVSRTQADGLLAALSRGIVPDSVFCNYVVSSIASSADRAAVLTILQALGSRAARVIVAVRSTEDACYQQVLGRVRATDGYLGIPDKTEPGLVVTGAGTRRQKFQKFFDAGEFTRLLKRHWAGVQLHALQQNDPALVAECTSPLPVDRAALERALRFEFDLPINGESMARGDAAVKTFRTWLTRAAARCARRARIAAASKSRGGGASDVRVSALAGRP